MSGCAFCGGKATLLCDSWLGWERNRGLLAKEAPTLRDLRSDAVPIRYRVVHTCDAPLCRACATRAGHMHVRMRGGGFFDTTDYCPGHDRGDRRSEITGLQAQAMRASWRAAARGHRERSAPDAPQLGLF